MAKSQTALRLRASHAEIVQAAVQHWQESRGISDTQAASLLDSIEVQTFDWEKFAKYSLRVAVLCLFISVSSIVFEGPFLNLLRRVLDLPPVLRGGATAVVAVGVHMVAYRRSLSSPQQKYAIEGIHAIGALFFALSAYQFIEQLTATRNAPSTKGADDESPQESTDDDHKKAQDFVASVWFGLATVYATVALLSGSNLIWSFSMVVLGYCLGGMMDYFGGTYYLGVESPLLFMAFGALLIGLSTRMRLYPISQPLWSTTRIWGLLYFFIPLWILSTYGYDDYFDQKATSALSRQAHMFLWSIAFFLAAAGSIWHSLLYDDSTTRGFGLAFLGINMYTKFAEYFWGWSKTVFFAVMAGSFAIIGKYAENVWNMSVPNP